MIKLTNTVVLLVLIACSLFATSALIAAENDRDLVPSSNAFISAVRTTNASTTPNIRKSPTRGDYRNASAVRQSSAIDAELLATLARDVGADFEDRVGRDGPYVTVAKVYIENKLNGAPRYSKLVSVNGVRINTVRELLELYRSLGPGEVRFWFEYYGWMGLKHADVSIKTNPCYESAK